MVVDELRHVVRRFDQENTEHGVKLMAGGSWRKTVFHVVVVPEKCKIIEAAEEKYKLVLQKGEVPRRKWISGEAEGTGGEGEGG